MKEQEVITTLFLDIGGVLLSNGWGRNCRRLAARHFNLDYDEFEERHHLSFTIYEEGKISLDDYLNRVVFFQERKFTPAMFRDFMFAQSLPDNEMIELARNMKEINHLKIAVVNNEGRELNEYRISKFGLNMFVDFFISSCFVHIRKPDPDIFRIALDIAQVKPGEVLYIEDRQLFIDVASDLGINCIHHTDFETTCLEIAAAGLKIPVVSPNLSPVSNNKHL